MKQYERGLSVCVSECVCDFVCRDHYEGGFLEGTGQQSTHTCNYSHSTQGPPMERPSAEVLRVKHPAACFLSACLPTERNRFITVSFNLTHTHREDTHREVDHFIHQLYPSLVLMSADLSKERG